MGLEYIHYEEKEGHFCGTIIQGREEIPVWLLSKFEDKWIVCSSDGSRTFRVKLKYEDVVEIQDNK